MNRRQIVLVATASIALAGAAARSEEFEVQRGLRYAEHDGVNITGDLYTPKAPGPYPALVAVHGGAYQVGNARGYQFWGPYLAQRGYVLFAIDYRLVKDGKKMYPEAVHDVRAAVQFLRRGTADDVNPPSESEAFLLALKQAGFAPVQTVVLPGASHFWMGDPIEEPGTHTGFLAPRLLRFLQRQL